MAICPSNARRFGMWIWKRGWTGIFPYVRRAYLIWKIHIIVNWQLSNQGIRSGWNSSRLSVFFLSWLLTRSLIFIGSRAQTLYQIIRMRQYTQYTLVLGVGFNTERCKLGEFKGFSCSGHVTYQIHTWLSKLKAPLTEQTWPKINTGYWGSPCDIHFLVKGLSP